MYYAIFISVFIVVFFLGLSLALAIHQSKVSSVIKTQKEINNKANKQLQGGDFKQTKVFYVNDYITYNKDDSCKKIISIDNENKKICLIDYSQEKLIIVGFEEILNYEIYENGSQQTFGGGAYGFWTGLFGAETNGMCKELKLIIRLKRYDVSQVCYKIIFDTSFNAGINKSSPIYQQCISTLQEVVSFLEVVKNENAEK